MPTVLHIWYVVIAMVQSLIQCDSTVPETSPYFCPIFLCTPMALSGQ